MSSPWLYALTVGPLGFYLWVLGLWHSHRYPKVVAGLLDFTFLAIGVGGVLAFGPFGRLLARALFGEPDTLDWLVLVSGYGLVGTFLARRSLHRVVVYHVDPASLLLALEDVLLENNGRFSRTLRGFEDVERGSGLSVDTTPWLRSAVVEAHGRDAERLIREVRPRLSERLRSVDVGPSPVAFGLFGLSMIVMLTPLVGQLITQPRAREALRVLLEKLRGV